jgi:hypothetical protein
MIYLVRTNKKITECYDWWQVKKILLKACADWINDKNRVSFEEYTAQELFDSCMNEQDFGDIAQVFRFTYPENEEKGFYFSFCNPQETFIGERIL